MISLLNRLADEVQRATTPEARFEALAIQGIALAQSGRIDESLEILVCLRTAEGGSNLGKGSVRRLILEGVIKYYQERSPESIDRTRRALALAHALAHSKIEAEAAMWLSHFAFNFSAYDELKSSIAVALDGFELLEDYARARICLIVADVMQFVGDREGAGEWYTLARILSRRDHDHAGMSAIEYNRLAMGLSRLRVEDVLGLDGSIISRRDWLTEISSVELLHKGLRSEALMELLLVCRSRLCQLSGDFEGALQILLEIRDSGVGRRCGVSDYLLDTELWWCSVRAGRSPSEVMGRSPTSDLIQQLAIEEQVGAAYFLSNVPSEYVEHLNRQWLDSLLLSTRNQCRVAIDRLKEALSPAADSVIKVKRIAGILPQGV